MNKKVMLSLVCVALMGSVFGKAKVPSKKQTKREINNHKFASGLNAELKQYQKKKDSALDRYLSEMSLPEKVSQLFIINPEGKETFYPIDKFEGKPYVPGGYLFFSYNLADTPEGVKAFTDNIRDYCLERNIIPPFLAVDEEGGWTQRLRKLAGKIPAQMEVAESMSVSEAYEMYRNHGKKMKAMGFHMNLAPVVEILSDQNKGFLENRSFGDKEKSVTYSIAEMNAYQNLGIGCVLKHFPGNTNTDPHTGLPEITLSENELEESLAAFDRCISLGAKAVLMSHARTSAIDSEVPACFSSLWVTEKLRKEKGFDGIIFSDDIYMDALIKNGYPPEVSTVKAVEAGIDCIMISEKRCLKSAQVLIKRAESDPALAKRIDESCRRILKYKMEAGILPLN